MKIVNVETINHADSYYKRLMGYMFQKKPLKSEVTIFDRCNSIHTFNMRFNLDILFLDAQNKVIKKVLSVPPCRLLPPVKGATKVAEAPEGLFTQIEENEVIIFDVLTGGVK